MEHAMSERQLEASRLATVSRADLKRFFGEIDDAKIVEILALKPTLPELEQAAMWIAGNGDVLARSGRPLTGAPAAIVALMTADEEEEPL
jgi:hypothetical protein